MHAIEDINARSAVMQVQAGATLQAVQEAAVEAGLVFGVDLGARGSCQIGGNVATNAGGNGVLQHGMMREQVLGLEVVLADGTVLPMLRPMLKNNTGYDLKQFFIGAEGTLGVITRVLLRLRPMPQAKATALVAMPSFDQALAVLQRMQRRFGNSVAAFELMWDNFVQASVQWQHLQAPFAERHPFLALIDVDGKDEASLREAVEEALGEAMEAGDVVDAVIAQSQTQAKTLWKLREAPAELNAHMHPPINFDVSLPQSEIGKFADAIQAAFDARWPGHFTLFFGHVGDGDLPRLHRWRIGSRGMRGRRSRAVPRGGGVPRLRVCGTRHRAAQKALLGDEPHPCRAGCHARHQGRARPLGSDEPRQGVLTPASPRRPALAGRGGARPGRTFAQGCIFLIAARV